MAVGNLLAPLPDARAAEIFESLFNRQGVRAERIISHGQTTPEETPYCQSHEEWVLVLAGAARLWMADRGDIALFPGDHVMIPAQVAHRVLWTSPDEPTIWLALHFDTKV